MRNSLALILAGILLSPLPALAEDKTTIVYVYPTSPAAFVPVAGLPSFLVMPGAPLPEVPAYVVRSAVVPAMAGYVLTPAADVDCSQIPGTVLAPAPDPYNLDKDDDGIGCEPEDR